MSVTSDLVLPLATTLTGSASGALFAYFVAARRSRIQARLDRAISLVDEYHGRAFLTHRRAVSKIPNRLQNDPRLVGQPIERRWDQVALGFADPGVIGRAQRSTCWHGPANEPPVAPDELDDHHHLTVYVAFITRLDRLIAEAKGDHHVAEALLPLRTEGIKYDADLLNNLAAALIRIHPPEHPLPRADALKTISSWATGASALP